MTSPAMILHQFEASPFSEKVRVILGLKNLQWRACQQPMIMPKPELQILTGGYRRIPVLQIGADLYFDTARIIDELERRFPEPSVYAGCGRGMGLALSAWSDAWGDYGLFWPVVKALFGSGDFPCEDAFAADRTALLGAPFDVAAMTETLPESERLIRGCLDLLERQLSDGRDFLFGAQLCFADVNAFHNMCLIRWGAGKIARLLEDFPLLLAWDSRVQAIGHGRRADDITQAEAVATARAALPEPIEPASPHPDLPPGCAVRIEYNDANTAPLEGELVAADWQFLSIRPTRSEIGPCLIHLPFSSGKVTRL